MSTNKPNISTVVKYVVECFGAIVSGDIEATWDSLNNTLTAKIDSGSFRGDEAIDIIMSIKIGNDGSIVYVDASATLMPYWSQVTAYVVPADIKDVEKHQVVKEAYFVLKSLEEIDGQINFDNISQLILTSIGYTEVTGLSIVFDSENSNAVISFDSAVYNNKILLNSSFEINFLNEISVVANNNIDYQSDPIIEYAFQMAIFSMQQLHENNTPVFLESLIDNVFVNEDSLVNLDVSANFNDADIGDQLRYSALLENGSNLPDWLIFNQSTGVFQGVPINDDVGSITVKVSATDNIGTSISDSFILTVSPSNSNAAISTDDVSIAENAITITETATHTDIDIYNNDNVFQPVADISAIYGTYSVQADGNWIYYLNNTNTTVDTLNTGDTLIDTITVTTEDGTIKDITITITGTNDTPIAYSDTTVVNEDTSVVIDVLANDTDVDSDALIVTSATAANGTVTINDDGTLTYQGNQDFNGTDIITYTVSDGELTDTTIVTVDINAVNDQTTVTNSTIIVVEDAIVLIDFTANATDIDGDTLTVTQATVANGTVTINADGTLTYQGDQDFNGTDTITYTITDGEFESTATVTVDVVAVNDQTTATNSTAIVDEDGAVLIDLIANATDIDGDALTITSASAANGTIVNGVYTPNTNFNGTDTITYTVNDSEAATVMVTVNAVNDAPVAYADTISTNEDASVTIDVLSNDIDIDNDALTVALATAVNGTVTINVDGTLTYISNSDFNGIGIITYTISDGELTDTVIVSVDINAVNDQTTVTNSTVIVDEDGAVLIDLIANATDIDGDALTITSASAANGTIVNDVYRPNTNFNGYIIAQYINGN